MGCAGSSSAAEAGKGGQSGDGGGKKQRKQTSNRDADFKVLQVLGQGASCTVNVAEEIATSKKYALKTLQKFAPDKSPVKDSKTMFQNEVSIMELLKHGNIIQMIDQWETPKAFNILSTLCEGGELFDRVKFVFETKGKFAERDAAVLAKEMLLALSYCHSKNIVHRDIKPENFVFETKSAASPMKLIDFGCAKQVADNVEVKDVAGSPYYVAPEVLTDRIKRTGSCWKASDMWSIGVIIYLMVVGQPPFDGQSHERIFRNIKRGRLRYPKRIKLSDEVKDLIGQLLRLDWTTRLSSDVALKHPWIADATVAPSEALDVVKQLGNFQSSCRLKRAVGRVLAKRMTEKDVAALQAAFDEFDSNGDGILGPEEIASMVKRIGHNEKGAQEFLELLDEDGDGVISKDEFQNAHAAARLSDKSEIKAAFDMFDKDGDGQISSKEIEEVCKFLTPDAVKGLIKDVDANGDGLVNFEEWLAALSNMDAHNITTKIIPEVIKEHEEEE